MIPEHGQEEERGAEDLAKVQGETQGLLLRIRQWPLPHGLLADALAARQQKAWERLNKRARRRAGKDDPNPK